MGSFLCGQYPKPYPVSHAVQTLGKAGYLLNQLKTILHDNIDQVHHLDTVQNWSWRSVLYNPKCGFFMRDKCRKDWKNNNFKYNKLFSMSFGYHRFQILILHFHTFLPFI